MTFRKCRNDPLASKGRLSMRTSKTSNDFLQESCANLPFESSPSGSSARTDAPQAIDRDTCTRRSGARMSASLTFAMLNRRGCTSQAEGQDPSDRQPRRRRRDVRDKRRNCCRARQLRCCRHAHEIFLCRREVSERTPRVMLRSHRMTVARTRVWRLEPPQVKL